MHCKIKYFHKINLLFWISLLGLISLSANAQRYTISNYSVDDGLAQSTVYSICEDQNGFVWFSTLGGGISRFDGVNFVQYNEKNGIVSNQVYFVFEDSKGNIWFGTRGGISVFDGYKIKTYGIKEGLKSNLIRVITEDKKGVIWVGTFGGGISKLQNDKFITYSTQDGLSSNFVYDITFNKSNVAFIATKAGLCQFDGKRFIQDHLFPLSSKSTRSVIFDKKGNLLVGTQTDGIYSITPTGTKTRLFSDSIHQFATNISHIFLDESNGETWISTLGNGIFLITDSSTINFTEENSALQSNVVLNIMKDDGGNVWVGTLGGGVSKLSKTPMFSYYKEAWLKEKAVRCIYEQEDGSLWFGTRNGGILSESKLSIDFSFLREYSINEIYKSKNEDLWIATDRAGIYKVSKKGELTHFDKNNGLISDKIFAIAEDDQGTIWLGTYDQGVISYQNEVFKNYNTGNGLSYDLVFDILFDGNDAIWVATNGGGLTRITPEEITSFDISKGLGSNDVWSVKQDVFGNIWAATNGGGISVFNGTSFKNFTEEDGLISNNVHSLLFDNANNLWIGTEKGIDKLVFVLTDTLGKVSYDIFKIQHYGKEEGLLGIETNLNASFKDSNGNLWFGTINGVTMHDPKKVFFNKNEPRINLTEVKIHYDTVNWISKYKTKLQRWSGLPIDLKLRSFDNHVTFEYAAISSHYSKKLKYQVKLEGFDEKWSKPISTNHVTYTNLPSGDFVFKVKACNEDDVWTQHPATFSFNIRTPIYKMPLFYICLGLFSILIAWILIRRRSYRIRKEKLNLEKIILDRTSELRQEKNNVELQNIEIVSQKRELEIKQRELESKNTQILDSINYAKKLQKAILSDEDKIKSHFDEYFLFFTPKDIVSGDFYWLKEQGDLLYIAAVDCTGHGVPGAFMSIVCNRLLNNAVNEFEFFDPGKMLAYLHQRLIEMMKKGAEDDYIRDGMDLALCIIDKNTKKLSYAGAHNPLFMVRDNKLQVIAADNKHVGFSMKMEKNRTFNTQHLDLIKGDQLYLFSDGFSDQFGGEKGSKYFMANFQSLIERISTEHMDEQYILLVNEFLDWKGEREQIDDVLVMGLKV